MDIFQKIAWVSRNILVLITRACKKVRILVMAERVVNRWFLKIIRKYNKGKSDMLNSCENLGGGPSFTLQG